jgi:hypothetical protein
MAIWRVEYHVNDETAVHWDDDLSMVCIDDEQVVDADGLDDLIEALQRIKADLARAKGGAA